MRYHLKTMNVDASPKPTQKVRLHTCRARDSQVFFFPGKGGCCNGATNNRCKYRPGFVRAATRLQRFGAQFAGKIMRQQADDGEHRLLRRRQRGTFFAARRSVKFGQVDLELASLIAYDTRAESDVFSDFRYVNFCVLTLTAMQGNSSIPNRTTEASFIVRYSCLSNGAQTHADDHGQVQGHIDPDAAQASRGPRESPLGRN